MTLYFSSGFPSIAVLFWHVIFMVIFARSCSVSISRIQELEGSFNSIWISYDQCFGVNVEVWVLKRPYWIWTHSPGLFYLQLTFFYVVKTLVVEEIAFLFCVLTMCLNLFINSRLHFLNHLDIKLKVLFIFYWFRTYRPKIFKTNLKLHSKNVGSLKNKARILLVLSTCIKSALFLKWCLRCL